MHQIIDSATYFVDGPRVTKIKYWVNNIEYIITADPLPYCFAPAKFDIENHYVTCELTNLKTVDTDETVKKYSFKVPQDVKLFRTLCEQKGINVYEADIKFIMRWMLDNKILCSNYENIAYWDTEEDDRFEMPNPETGNVPIITISVWYKGQKHSWVGDEKYIIKSFRDWLIENKIQALGGWNSHFWDVPFITRRSQINGINFDTNRWRFIDLMLLYKYTQKNASRYSLEVAAAKHLKKDKPYVGAKIGNLPDAQKIERCEWDAQSTSEIDGKLGLSKLAIALAKKAHLFPDTVLGVKKDDKEGLKITVTPTIDNFFLRQGRSIGYVIPVKKEYQRPKYQGAIVYLKETGLYDNVMQLDFDSLYPNVILGFNLAPYGKPELLHPVIRSFLDGKDAADKAGLEDERWAYKILANAVYGIMASKFCRIRVFEVAQDTTRHAREILLSIIDLMKNLGYNVLYGDTDSIFVQVTDYSVKDDIIDMINTHVRNIFHVDNIHMNFEGYWSVLGFPRGSGKESVKKRYYGLQKYDKKSKEVNKIVIKGLEHERGDWSQPAKDIQYTAINMRVSKATDEEKKKFCEEVKTKLYAGEYDDRLDMSKNLTKPLSAYKVLPPHVRAYKDAIKMGVVPSESYQYNIVRYVITKGGIPKLSTLAKHGDYDYDYYWSRQFEPILFRMGMTEDKTRYKTPRKVKIPESGQGTL